MLLYTTLFAIFTTAFCAYDGYYWREFTGTIPSDAIIAGRDIDGRLVFIGQGYVSGGGLMVGQIQPGQRKVLAEYGGVKVLQKYIKILCGQQKNFRWVSTNSKNFHADLKKSNGKLVIGGHEVGYGPTSIGRLSFEHEIKVGKVNSFYNNDVFLHVAVSDSQAIKAGSYEVLVFDGK